MIEINKRFSRYSKTQVNDSDLARIVGINNYNMLYRKFPYLYSNLYNIFENEIYDTTIIDDLLITMSDIEIKTELIKFHLVNKNIIDEEVNQNIYILVDYDKNVPYEEIKTCNIIFFLIFFISLLLIGVAITKLIMCEDLCFVQ